MKRARAAADSAVGIVGGSTCVICGVDCGSAANLLAHADSHADESATSGRQAACPALDCEVVLHKKEMVDHIVTVHYGLRWECSICNALHTTSRDAARCEHKALLAIAADAPTATRPKPATPKTAAAAASTTTAPHSNGSAAAPARHKASGDGTRGVKRGKVTGDAAVKREDGARNGGADGEQSRRTSISEGNDFAKRMTQHLRAANLSSYIVPTRIALAASPWEMTQFSEGQCTVMANAFVRQVDAALQRAQTDGAPLGRASIRSTDRLWSGHFVQAYLASMRRGESFRPTGGEFDPADLLQPGASSAAPPTPPVVVQQMPPPPAPPTVQRVTPRPPVVQHRSAPNAPVANPQPRVVGAALDARNKHSQQPRAGGVVAEGIIATPLDPTPVRVEVLVAKLNALSDLLAQSDHQLRTMMNIVSVSKRRILDAELDCRKTKKLLLDTNRQLETALSTNRDLRVKILYDEKASKRTHERLLREAQQGGSVAAADAASELLKLKRQLSMLKPLFPPTVDFRRAEVVYMNQVGDKESAAQARVTQDVSGRTWVALDDLKRGDMPMLQQLFGAMPPDGAGAVARAEAPPVVNVNHVDLLMCFRTFSLGANGVAGAPPATEWLVSVDWPGFGGGLAVMD